MVVLGLQARRFLVTMIFRSKVRIMETENMRQKRLAATEGFSALSRFLRTAPERISLLASEASQLHEELLNIQAYTWALEGTVCTLEGDEEGR